MLVQGYGNSRGGVSISKQIVEAFPDPLLVLDQTLKIVRVNHAAEDLICAGRKRMIGASLEKFLSEDSAIFTILNAAFNRGSAIDAYDIGMRLRQSGQELRIDLRLAPLSLGNEGAFGRGGGESLFDGLLIQMSRTPRLSTPPGQEARQSAITFATLLHEIRNPLTGISGAAQLLQDTVSEADQPLVSLIRDEIERIISLTRNMWEFGDIAPPRQEVVNVHLLIERALDVLSLGQQRHHTSDTHKISVIKTYDPSLPDSYVDRDQIVQVLMNLLKNAQDALGSRGGEIEIKTSWSQDWALAAELGPRIQIEVIDSGAGIAPDIRDRVFEPFQSTKSDGQGIGLALSAQMTEANGGTLTLEAKPGDSRTCFCLKLPQAHRGA